MREENFSKAYHYQQSKYEVKGRLLVPSRLLVPLQEEGFTQGDHNYFLISMFRAFHLQFLVGRSKELAQYQPLSMLHPTAAASSD